MASTIRTSWLAFSWMPTTTLLGWSRPCTAASSFGSGFDYELRVGGALRAPRRQSLVATQPLLPAATPRMMGLFGLLRAPGGCHNAAGEEPWFRLVRTIGLLRALVIEEPLFGGGRLARFAARVTQG